MSQLRPSVPLSDSITYTEIYDEKFKTCALYFRFFVKRTPQTAAVNALMIDLLTNCSADYPTLAALTLKKQSLYGASLHSIRGNTGDVQELTIAANWIDDRFALEGESVTDAMAALMLGCILRPNAQNNAFDAAAFRFCKQNLLDTIDCEINQKRSYAMLRAAGIAFEGEPAACPPYGTRESAEQITAESAFAAWETMLKTAPLEIVAVLPSEKPKLLQMLSDAFSSLQRDPVPVMFESASPCKASPSVIEEPMPVTQCKLVLALKTADAPHEAMQMLNLLLGGTTGSLLFANVREKLSLCYYCASRYQRSKHTLIIDCGVRTDKLCEAKEAILDQCKALREGGFTDAMMEEAILFYEHSLASASDAQSGLAAWVFQQKQTGRNLTMEESIALLRTVTREQIIAAANAMQLDTVYTLLATKSEDENGEEVSE